MKSLCSYIIPESVFNTNVYQDVSLFDMDSIKKDISDASGEYIPNWYWPENEKSIPYSFFRGRKITKLDISNIRQTGSISNLNNSFSDMIYLKEFIAEDMDFHNLESMHGMFYDCPRLESVYISNWKTGKVSSIDDMFLNDHNLRAIDLSAIHFAPKLTITDAFRGCSKLESIDLGSNTNCSAGFGWGGTPPNLFKQCWNLKYIRLGSLNMAYKDDSLKDCEKLEVFDGEFILTSGSILWTFPKSLRSMRIKIRTKPTTNHCDFSHLVNLDTDSIQYIIDNLRPDPYGTIEAPSIWSISEKQKSQIKNKKWKLIEK